MRSKQQGFTLLEIMVVVAMMGLIAVVIIMTMPSDNRNNLISQTETLTEAIKLAADRALLEGCMMGVIINTDSWQVVTLQPTGKASNTAELIQDYFRNNTTHRWQPWLYRRLPLQRQLPEIFSLSLTIQDIPTDLQSDQNNSDVDRIPQIWLFPGGEITPFEITVTKKATPTQSAMELRIKGDALGNIKLVEQDGVLP